MSTSFFSSKKDQKKKVSAQREDYSFTLTNIDVAKIDNDFNIDKMKEFGFDLTGKTITFDSTESTSLEKLGISSLRKEPIQTIISKDKKKICSYLSFVDINTRLKMESFTTIPCYGCRRKFSSQPLGIPIEFHPSIYVSRNDHTKTKRLTTREKEKIQDKNTTIENTTIENTIIEKDYFDTEGVVCSFNCIISCIEDSPSPLYKNTPYLISLMYKLIFGKYPEQKIIRSPSWKMRQEYGGPLSDEEFEKSLQTIQFTDTHQCRKLERLFNPVSRVFDAKDIELK
jgi:hypothetical protein